MNNPQHMGEFSEEDAKARNAKLIVADFGAESIVSIRRAKSLIDLGNSKIEKAYIKFNDKKIKDEIKAYMNFIIMLAKCEQIEFSEEKLPKAICDVSENLEIFITLENVDLSGILTRLENQKNKLEKESFKLNSMLSNEKFIANAPKEVVEQNKEALENLKIQLEKISVELQNLRG
ncbi:valine--tRNA ligase, partial [Campylobacter jejuni]